MAKTPFHLEASITTALPATVKADDKIAAHKWLKKTFYFHYNDFTLNGRKITARVQDGVKVDLAQVKGSDFAQQLQSFHALVKAEFAKNHALKPSDIYQVDAFITG
jgi:hypothetical protein